MILNSYWLLTWDAVAVESTGRSGDASSKHSWAIGWFQAEVLELANSYWPLTSAGSLHWNPRETNFHWLMAQAVSQGQPRGMLNFHWLSQPAASPYVVKVAKTQACERHLWAAYFLKVQERSSQ